MQKRIPAKLPIITNIINRATSGLAVTAISGYQKFISPHKGFACAHRVLYGCDSCSQYFKRVIAEEGILTAIANARGRFQECREANEILKSGRAKCRSRQKYYASRVSSTILAIESEESDNPDLPQNPEEAEEAEANNPNKPKLGGSQWGRKRTQTNNNDGGGGKNNGDRCDYVDCNDCGYGLDIIPSDCGDDHNCNNVFEAIDCPDLSCPDLNCGNADCLSGMDCSGLDCSGLDCGGCG